MRVLITGASGFLGGHLVDIFIKAGHQVKVLVRKTSDISHMEQYGDQITYSYGDIDKEESCHRATENVDLVIHSAARAKEYGSYETFVKTNVDATKYLVQGAQKNKVAKFIFISSPSVVAEFQDQVDIDETYPYPEHALNYYCDTKGKAEQYVISQNGNGILTTSIRPRGIWGPRDKTGFLPKLMKRIAEGKLKNLANGEPVMTHVCHVYNVAHACLLASTSDKVAGNTYFITDDEPIEVWGFLNRLATLFGLPVITKNANPKVVLAVTKMLERLWKIPYLRNNKSMPLSLYALGLLSKQSTYDTSKARKDFGYHTIISSDEGVSDLKQWIDEIGGIEAFYKHV